jgi:hypothetical protein
VPELICEGPFRVGCQIVLGFFDLIDSFLCDEDEDCNRDIKESACDAGIIPGCSVE